MAKKSKKFLRITFFSCIIISILFIITYLGLKFYIKYSIESEINKELNTKFKINDLQLSFKNNTILFSNISLSENIDYKNDTLIFIEKIFVKINKKSNLKNIIFDEIKIANAFVKNDIFYRKNIFKMKDSLNEEQNSRKNFEIFVNNLILENINLRKNNISIRFDMDLNFDTLQNINNFSMSLIADNIFLKLKSDSTVFFTNVNYKLNYIKDKQFLLNINDLKIKTNNDSICGDLCFKISKTDNNIINSINGKINLENFLKHFDINDVSKFVVEVENTEDSTFTLKTDAIFENDEKYYFLFYVAPNKMVNNFYLKNKIIFAYFENVIYNIKNIFNANEIKIENILNIKYFNINNLKFNKEKSFLKNSDFSFNNNFDKLKQISLKSTINVDTIIFQDYFLYDLKLNCNIDNTVLTLKSNPFRINNLLLKTHTKLYLPEFKISSKTNLTIPNTNDNQKYLLILKNYSKQNIKFNNSGATKFILDITGTLEKPEIKLN